MANINKIERRYISTEVRMKMKDDMPDKKKPMMEGYAALFNSLSDDLGGFREKIAPGAFKKAIKKGDCRALWNHDSNHVLGRMKSKTLRLKEDETGLSMECELPDTMCAKDLMVSMERGDVDQMSFSFRVAYPNGDTWERQGDEIIRTILEVDELYDVSPVTFPAYGDTSVALRSLEEFKNKEAESRVDPMVDLKLIEEEDELYRTSLMGL